MSPLVSILIPAFNADRWIAETIRSALAQTWPRKEILIVDDGSTDETVSIARKFASKNVAVVTQENQGAAAARNKAFELCHGDYIQWLDADDLLSPDKIAKQIEAAKECQDNRQLYSAAWGYFQYRVSCAHFSPSPLWCDLSPVEWLVRKWEHNTHMQTATWLVSRELTLAAGPWDGRLLNNDDGEYFCRVLQASNGVRFVPDGKVFYRTSGSNRLSYVGRSNRKIEAHFLGMQLQINCLRSLEDSKRVRAACMKHLQVTFIYFYPECPDLIGRVQELAAELGGQLEIPQLRWKYAWIQPILGYHFAKCVQLALPRIKWSMASAWDKSLFLLGEKMWHLRKRHGRKQNAE